MSYNVYQVRYGPVLADPDVPGTRYHNIIFVEMDSRSGSGEIHHVTGDLVTGMRYETRFSNRPEDSRTFKDKTFLGTISQSQYPQNIRDILQTLPPPPKQKAFNAKTMKTEPVKPDGTFYQPGEARPRIIKCTEWTENQAIPALRSSGILTRS